MSRLASIGVAAVAVLLAVGGPVHARRRAAVEPRSWSSSTRRRSPARPGPPRRSRRSNAPSAASSWLSCPPRRLGWRYRLVANGFSLSLPSGELPALRELAGVRDVLPTASYAPRESSSPQEIGAPELWGQSLDTAGQGVKIGIIDSGIDPDHPYFNPTGYTMPPGFPKGQLRFTTPKVIVARVFPPKTGATAPSVRLAFSPDDSSHGTHVAGIAAGQRGHADRPGTHLRGRAARISRQLQGVRRDRLRG